MKAGRTIGVLAACTAVATAMAGCSAPGANKQAVSFAGMTHTEGEVAQAARQMNEIVPAQARQQTGIGTFTRMSVISLLLYTPALTKAAGESGLKQMDAQIDQQIQAMEKTTPSAGKLTATSKETLRNFLVVANGGVPNLMEIHGSLVKADPPKVSSRYGTVDWKAGGQVTPHTGGGVVFNTHDPAH